MSNLVGVAATSPGKVPISHSHVSNPMVSERRVRSLELVLRVLICALGALTVFLIVTDTQIRVILTIQKKAKFTEMKALVFLVIANGILASYSLLQVVRCAVGLLRGSVLFNKPLAWAIFSADQVMAYLSLAAVGAALQSSAIAKMGQSELQWMKVCDMFEKYCNQSGGGIASAVVASLCAAITSSISAYSLFRLFGSNKSKSNGYW